jgi:hypothetical protein
MAHSYWIDLEKDLVYLKMWGTITDAEIIEQRAERKCDPLFCPTRPVLIDLTSVTDFALTVDFVRQCGRDDREYALTHRAYVVRSQYAYGTLRMYQILQDQNPVAIFLDADDAEQWARGHVHC